MSHEQKITSIMCISEKKMMTERIPIKSTVFSDTVNSTFSTGCKYQLFVCKFGDCVQN